MSAYNSGRYHEYRVRDILEADERHEVRRIAGSGRRNRNKTMGDLIAWNDTLAFEIEVKSSRTFTRKQAKKVLQKLHNSSKWPWVVPVVIWREWKGTLGVGKYAVEPKHLQHILGAK